jgi:hypothetical protein
MRSTLLIACLLIIPGSLAAQGRWTLSFERGYTTFSETAHDTSTPPVRAIPWHPASYSLRLAHDGERVGLAFALTAAGGQLAGQAEDIVVLPGVHLLLLEFAPELRWRLSSTSAAAVLIAHAGPVVDLWAPEGDDVRAAYGGMGGLTLSLPLTRRWEVTIRSDLAITGSEATREEESDQIKRARTMRRGRLALGITRIL